MWKALVGAFNQEKALVGAFSVIVVEPMDRFTALVRIYNASKFRLASHRWAAGEVLLRVGLTDYKDHVGTNLSPDVQKFIGQGDDKVKRVASPDLSSSVWANCISV